MLDLLIKVLSIITSVVALASKAIGSIPKKTPAKNESATPKEPAPISPATQSSSSRTGLMLILLVIRHLAMAWSAIALFLIAISPEYAVPLQTREAALIAINLGIFLMVSQSSD